MTPLQIIQKASEGKISASEYVPATEGIRDLNIIYDDFVSDIISELWESHYWNRIKASLVSGQEEYNIIETGGLTSYDIDQVLKVSVKYSSGDANYTPARRVDPANLPNDDEWYGVNQPKTDPIYFVRDNSVFLYPYSTENVTGGLKISAILQPVALTIAGTEDDIKIRSRFHVVLVRWVEREIYAFLKLPNDYNNADTIYQNAKRQAIIQLKGRVQEPAEITEPNLSYFQ